MVNTRRMESSGSAPNSGPRHRTRRSGLPTQESEISSVASDSETEEKENGWESEEDSKINSESNVSVPQVRELRSRFVLEADREFSPKHLSRRLTRTSHLTIGSKRHSLSVYSSRNMHDDTDYNSEDEMFSSRARKLRHPSRRHTKKKMLSRLEKRTALSLRPLSIKSYADPHSPLTYNSDDSDAEKDVVRRSKRKRTSRFEPQSWLQDNQMPKVGYPSMSIQDYTDDDSRDMPEVKCRRSSRRSEIRETREMTKLSHEVNGINGNRREIKKNSKYMFDYETPEASRNHRIQSENLHPNNRNLDNRLRTRHESVDNKENKESNGTSESKSDSGKDVKVKTEAAEETEDVDVEEENKNDENKDKSDNDNEHQDEQEDLSRTARKLRIRRKNANCIDDSYSPRGTRNRKRMDSTSSSEVNRVYSLRQRAPPKPSNKPNLEPIMRPRRRFTRRKVSSSSDSSTDSEDLCRKKPSKYRSNNQKNNKNKGDHLIKSGAGNNKPLPIGPETIDNKVRFSSVGGLDGHVQCLKEMILLPMMYPEVFKQFQIHPPRGVLFHGPPGTGKTLIARALANECSFGSRKVSFFMRKGADLLSKWVGESEKQLRLLFEQAQELKPSIIFFDELDGLAPVRSSRQDQIHASIVSTLLALMDGLENRGEVIVIGATNRIDAIDPALRRPGRFDRELFFPLPARMEREEILNVHVSQWKQPPSSELLSYLAESATGYCGSDLRALCTEAVIQSFRRTYPQVYTADYRLLLDPNIVNVEKVDFLRAKSLLVPASHRIVQCLGRKLLPILEPVLGNPLKDIFCVLKQIFPHGVEPALAKVKLAAGVRPSQLLLAGDGSQHGQTLHLAPALLHQMEHIHAHILDLSMLYRETARSPEESCLQVFQEARRNIPSVVYVPGIDELWSLVTETVKSIILSQLSQMDPNIPILFLATAHVTFDNLPIEIQNVFSQYRREVYQLNSPNTDECREFFKPLLIDACIRAPKSPRKRFSTPPPLPRAPTPPPTPMTQENAKKLLQTEESSLRELRIFLRDICKKLANNKLFFMFTKPVDTEEVPDYTSIISQPMDLETMMTKVDLHRYECAKDFLNDIDLIVQNALEYNPARTSADKQIRHRACSLRDCAYALIKNEMDSDFEDHCQQIAKRRTERKASVTQYLPPYINTVAEVPDNPPAVAIEGSGNPSKEIVFNGAIKEEVIQEGTENFANKLDDQGNKKNISGSSTTPIRKRRTNSWQRGCLKKIKRKEKTSDEKISPEEDSKDGFNQCDDQMSVSNLSNSVNNELLDNTLSQSTNISLSCDSATIDTVKSNGSSPLKSSGSTRRLSDFLSPSELLDDPLEFDHIDKTLNDEVSNPNQKSVNIQRADLEAILEEVVQFTANHCLDSLLDLHNQLGRIVRKYLRTYHRQDLVKELRKELLRYKDNPL